MMNKNLVFVFDNEDIPNVIDIGNKEGEIFVISKNSQIKEELLKKGIKSKIINEYVLTDSEITKPIQWIKSWPNKILINNKNFKELFMYKKITIFWFLESRLYHKRIHELITTIEQIKKILSIEKPKKIWIIKNKEFEHIISNLHTNVRIIKKLNGKTSSNISEDSHSGFLVWKLLLLKIFRGNFIHINKIDKKKAILFLTEVGSWRKTYNYVSKKYEYQDVFFHNIIKKIIKKNQNVEIIDFENKSERLLNSFLINKERQKSFEVKVIPWEKFLTIQIILKSKKIHTRFKKIWQNLKNSETFKKSLNYEGIPIYNLVKDDFDELFNSFKALVAIAMIETAEKIVETKKPSKIVMHDEYGALQLSFLIASKDKRIPTISLQHGTIYENAFAYTHNDNDINNVKKGLVFPLPDKMCVWSESVKNTLITSAKFPSTVPIITGDPKMEAYNENYRKFDHKRMLNKLGIKYAKKIILFATENLPNLEERNLISTAIIESIKELDGCSLIIKVHPNETDLSFYQKIIEKINCTSCIIVKDEDIYELIQLCDLVIVSYSTVGLEAMRMFKPVISLNLLGIHNESIIIKNNLSTVVSIKTELIPTIKRILNEYDKRKLKTAKDFAEKELGKIQVDATDRITKEILNLKFSNDRSGV